jgi:hypothetical protein
MARLSDYRFELQHNGDVLGHVCAGATEHSEVCTDPAFYWFGLRAFTRMTARARALGVPLGGPTLPSPRANLIALIVG